MIGALVWKPLAYPTTEGTYEQFLAILSWEWT